MFNYFLAEISTVINSGEAASTTTTTTTTAAAALVLQKAAQCLGFSFIS